MVKFDVFVAFKLWNWFDSLDLDEESLYSLLYMCTFWNEILENYYL